MTLPVSTAIEDIAAVVAAPASQVLPRQRTTQPVATRSAPPRWRAARSKRPLDCVVIGGGFAGLQSALELADAGMRVTVLEQSRELMGGASRNNMAAHQPRISVERHGPVLLCAAVQHHVGRDEPARNYRQTA